MRVVILEDNLDRQLAMRDRLLMNYAQYAVEFHESVAGYPPGKRGERVSCVSRDVRDR